ncbi:MAG: DNA polymerase IV [Firmicutes bacterium]|nr:DNA polymerase IV [Bacillota bacterium]
MDRQTPDFLKKENTDRVILHCDMNGFYASVELLDRPDLKDKPMAVCGDPESRHGIILAKNELAKRAGVVTAETIWQARKKCPDLQLVRPHRDKYAHYSNLINQIYLRFTDMVEPFSIDESWLDVTASQTLFGSGKEIADTIRHTVKTELGLTLSVGVSFNKIFAKLGSDYKKPDATTVISRENFRDLLWPLPAGALIFVGKATADRLLRAGIKTIGDIAHADPKMLHSLLGKQGDILWNYANGYDSNPVARFDEGEPIKSIGNGVTFRRNLTSEDDILTAITSLADTVAGRLRKHKLKAFGVKVDIKDPAFKTISRQKQLMVPTNLAEEVARACMELIHGSWRIGMPIRLLTVTAINLCDEMVEEQISLFANEEINHQRGEKLERTMDHIRDKFGTAAITFGGILGNDLGLGEKDPKDSAENATSPAGAASDLEDLP